MPDQNRLEISLYSTFVLHPMTEQIEVMRYQSRSTSRNKHNKPKFHKIDIILHLEIVIVVTENLPHNLLDQDMTNIKETLDLVVIFIDLFIDQHTDVTLVIDADLVPSIET